MLMTFDESINACKNIDDWKFVTSFSVGGFEWTGFSKENPNKLIIISSQIKENRLLYKKQRNILEL